MIEPLREPLKQRDVSFVGNKGYRVKEWQARLAQRECLSVPRSEPFRRRRYEDQRPTAPQDQTL